MREAPIAATARTGIGRAYRGAFNDTEAPVLAAHGMNAVVERAGIDPARYNVNGGTIAVGHPFGMTDGRGALQHRGRTDRLAIGGRDPHRS